MQSIAYTLTYDNVLVIKYFCTTTDVWRTYTRTVICGTLTQHFLVKLWNEDRNPAFAAVVPSLLGFIEKICNDFIKFFTLKENVSASCFKEVLLEPCLYYWKFCNTLNNILGIITSTWYMLFLQRYYNIFDTYHLSNGWICNPHTMKEVVVQHLSSYACHWAQQSFHSSCKWWN